jgi:hypothetical protein
MRPPDLRVDVWVSPAGVQTNFYRDGKIVHEYVRSISRPRSTQGRLARLLSQLQAAIDRYRDGEDTIPVGRKDSAP